MDELALKITSTGDGGFVSEALRSPLHVDPAPAHRFAPPLSAADLARLHEHERAYLVADAAGQPPPPVPDGLSATAVGTRIFDCAFGGAVGEHYRDCRRAADELRLRLVFLRGDPKSEYLAALPWETAYDPVENLHLARQRATPLVRDVELAQRLRPLEVELPLRVLIVAARPTDMHALDLAAEERQVQEALAPLLADGLVEVAYASTLRELRDKLVAHHAHVLHFMGHGGYLEDEGLGALYLETPEGRRQQVDGDLFGELVAGVPDLRLVVLNACNTARYSGAPDRRIDYGAATGVLQRTGCSVLAMRRAISDGAAIRFGADLYGQLADEAPVDVAAAEARLRLTLDGPEWSTPVLFLAAPDGRLFRVADRRRRAARPAGSKRGRAVRPVRLGIRSMVVEPGEEDHGRFLPRLTEDCLDLRRHFDGRFIREDRLWHEAVLPELREFLQRHAFPGRRLELMFAAHLSVAFAAGWSLDAKSGLEIAVGQPTSESEPSLWSGDDGTGRPAGDPVWEDRPDMVLHPDRPDVALAIGVSREVIGHVRTFLSDGGLPVGRVVDAVPAGGAGWRSVAGGAHALQLALALSRRAEERRPHERTGRLHVIAAAPAALMLHLGRLGRAWGETVLYEHPLGSPGSYGRYRASLTLPPPGTAQPPPGW